MVDEVAPEAGHELMCLPVAHYTLKLAWAQVKGHLQEHFAWSGFEVVTPEHWPSLVNPFMDWAFFN